MSNKAALAKAKEGLQSVNGNLKELGLFPIELVAPDDCVPQDKNARYMDADTFDQLANNIKQAGALESVPLVFQDEALKAKGKYAIISGHHRVEAAKKAGIPYMMVMVLDAITRDELVSKQISHNALAGKDNAVVLKELFDSIQDINAKMSSGIISEIGKVKVETLSFKLGVFKSFNIMFTPTNIAEYDDLTGHIQDFARANGLSGDVDVRIAALDDYTEFTELMMSIKKSWNIKSTAAAFNIILKLAKEKFNDGDSALAKYVKQKQEEKNIEDN